jgi:murein DD-endopeptidase MepM/ murein hydrolase activator NlpD
MDVIESIEKDLLLTVAALTEAEAELIKITELQEAQYELIKERLKYIHENGTAGYLEVLLGSRSFADFINRLDHVNAVIRFDNEIIQRYVEAGDLIAQTVTDIGNDKTKIEFLLYQAEAQRDIFEAAVAEKAVLIALIVSDEDLLARHITELEEEELYIRQLIKEAEEEAQRLREEAERLVREEADRLAREAAERAAIERAERLAREAADRAALEAAEAEAREKAAREAAEREAVQSALSAGTDSDADVAAFIWPVPGYLRISSPYGFRINPITGLREHHNGIDIPAPTGTDIVAVADGRVVYSGYNGGMGYMIVIDHGGGITTLYAHNSRLLVSSGTNVTQGQVIARCGSTGMSTGPHLHFEVRIDGVHTSPMGYLP